MFIIKLALLVILQARFAIGSSQVIGFTYNEFRSKSSVVLDGAARFTHGMLQLTDDSELQMGHAFYPNPIRFKSSSSNGSANSFSTTFIFKIRSKDASLRGHGMAFVVAPHRDLRGAQPGKYLGVFSNTSSAINHVFAVELDTFCNDEFHESNSNHVGIDVNGLISVKSELAGYYSTKRTGFEYLELTNGDWIHIWIEYDGVDKQITVTLAPAIKSELRNPIVVNRPNSPLINFSFDLSPIMKETMYVGFSSSTGSGAASSHFVHGWSFKMNGEAEELAFIDYEDYNQSFQLGRIVLASALLALVTGLITVAVCFPVKMKVPENWELDYGSHQFKYNDLYVATNGFTKQRLLGAGGFGKVYRGVLPTSRRAVAVKRISHDSRQGIREFEAEIVSLGRLRHRNLVTLLGYCRRKREPLLVYDYMPNGSLNRYLCNEPKVALDWGRRFRIIKGVASGLLYLHEGWDQVVIHRDVKASNVLLDADMNARLGDFGLARLYNHGAEPYTTHVAGTLGYLAPEHIRTRKATKATDVYAFGAFLLEVATARKPIEVRQIEDAILVDWVFSCWSGGNILEAVDSKLGFGYDAKEMELVLKLGLMCSHSDPSSRPSMRQVVQYLEGDTPLHDLSTSLEQHAIRLTFTHGGCYGGRPTANLSTTEESCLVSSCVVVSILSGGR